MRKATPDILGEIFAYTPPVAPIQPTFDLLYDYAELDTETRIVVQQRTHEIKGLVRRTAQDVIDIGGKLIEVKERLGHGKFGDWLKAEFEWSEPTALRFMRVTSRFENRQIDGFAPSALYLLAAPSTPDEAREDAIARATNGETITHAAAKEIVQQYKPEPLPARPAYIPPSPSEHGVIFGDGEPKPYQTGTILPNGHSTTYTPSRFEPEPEPEPDELDEPASEPEITIERSVPVPLAVHFSSESPEHYTPVEIIDAVIACMGGIDLDPCSNSKETPNVPAAMHYTREDDGLSQVWQGCVYMNPPYGREIDDWIAKLVDAHKHGEVTEAIALVPARTDTQWWQRLRDYHVCLVTGRLKFLGNGNGDSAPFPSAVFYLGCNVEKFVSAFEELGDIWHRTRHGFCFGE